MRQQTERALPDRAGNEKPVTRLRRQSRSILRRIDFTPGSNRDDRSATRAERVAATQCQAVMAAVLGKAARKGIEPVRVPVAPEAERQRKAGRHGSLGGKIGQVHPQRLLGDGVGRISRQEVDRFGDCVLGDDQRLTRRDLHQRSIVLKAKRAFTCERREVALDQFELADFFAHGRILASLGASARALRDSLFARWEVPLYSACLSLAGLPTVSIGTSVPPSVNGLALWLAAKACPAT